MSRINITQHHHLGFDIFLGFSQFHFQLFPVTERAVFQQRVAVARALANNPRLVLADEPTANVDAANQQSIVDLIRVTCREENAALLMVTHAPEVAEQFDRVEQLAQINRVAVSGSITTMGAGK